MMHRYSANTIEAIAMVCHEANTAFSHILETENFPIAPHWDQAPLEMQFSAIRGVQTVLENPDITAPELHEKWCADKIADGWKYGPVKDARAKEHPCLVDYWALPEEQRRKDDLFRAIVFALK